LGSLGGLSEKQAFPSSSKYLYTCALATDNNPMQAMDIPIHDHRFNAPRIANLLGLCRPLRVEVFFTGHFEYRKCDAVFRFKRHALVSRRRRQAPTSQPAPDCTHEDLAVVAG